MNCGYAEKIILYFYGELPESAAEDVKSHLGACASCGARLSMLGSLSENLNSLAAHVPALSAEELLRAAHPDYPDMPVRPEQEFDVWGVVQWNVHRM